MSMEQKQHDDAFSRSAFVMIVVGGISSGPDHHH